MRAKTLEKLCCPFDKQDIALQVFVEDIEQNVLKGLLTCKHCNRIYPIIHGIPIMSPDEYRDFQLEKPLLENWKSQSGNNDVKLLTEEP